MGLQNTAHDHCECINTVIYLHINYLAINSTPYSTSLVLTSEEASLIAMEYDLNPIVDDEAAMDLFPK